MPLREKFLSEPKIRKTKESVYLGCYVSLPELQFLQKAFTISANAPLTSLNAEIIRIALEAKGELEAFCKE